METKQYKILLEACNNDYGKAKRVLSALNDNEIIEFEARLAAKQVHAKKWKEVFFSIMTFIVSIVALFSSMAENVGNMQSCILVFCAAAVMLVIQMSYDNVKEEKRKYAECMLDAYLEEQGKKRKKKR